MMMVSCSVPESSDCTNSNFPFIPLMNMTYATCCSMVRAEDRYYLDQDGLCHRCGKSTM